MGRAGDNPGARGIALVNAGNTSGGKAAMNGGRVR